MNKRTSLIVGLVAAASTLTACGSSAKTAASTATVASSGTGATVGTTAGGGTTATPAATTKAAASGGGSVSNFCALSKQFKAKYSDSTALSSLGQGSAADMKKFFQGFAADVKTWEAAAPANIKPAIAAETQGLTAMNDALAKYDYDITKAATDPAFSAASASFGNGGTIAGGASANDAITAYMKDTCGIADDTTATTDTTTA